MAAVLNVASAQWLHRRRSIFRSFQMIGHDIAEFEG